MIEQLIEQIQLIIARWEAYARSLERQLANCRSNVQTAVERNQALRDRVRDLQKALAEERRKRTTLVNNTAATNMNVTLDGADYTVKPGQRLELPRQPELLEADD